MDAYTVPDPTVRLIRVLSAGAKRIVFVSGNFNIVHPGHLRLLKFAAEAGDFLVVGVSDDSTPGVTVPAEMRVEGSTLAHGASGGVGRTQKPTRRPAPSNSTPPTIMGVSPVMPSDGMVLE